MPKRYSFYKSSADHFISKKRFFMFWRHFYHEFAIESIGLHVVLVPVIIRNSIFSNYFQGNESIEEYTTIMKILPAIGIFAQVFEMLCLSYIFYFLHKHDSSMLKNSVISKEIYKKRQSHNSLTLGGQVNIFNRSIFLMIISFS